MLRQTYRLGDLVVYCKAKHSTHPGRRAKNIHASEKGDNYNYIVNKFWIVSDSLADGQLLLKTRRGKTHLIDPNDPNLRHATLLERLRHRMRFSQLVEAEAAS